MLAAAKLRLTEITITEGNKTTQFRLPAQAGRGLLTLLRSLQKDLTPSASAREFFPDLKNAEKRIGVIFRGIRFKNGLTQAEVAKRLGLDQSDVSKIEKGKSSIGKGLAKKIEHEFGIDYRRFL